jgi:hypothetical protein
VEVRLADDAVCAHGDEQRLHVVRRHVIATVEQCGRLARLRQRQRASRGDAQVQLFVVTRGIDEVEM